MQAYFALHQIDLLARAVLHAQLEVQRPVLAEAGIGNPGLCVKGDQPVSNRHVEDSRLLAVAPVSQAASRKPSRGRFAAVSFMFAVHPQQFAGGCVERDDGAARSASGINHAANHERRSFKFVFRPRPEIVGFESPGNLQLVEVGSVDLIEGPVARTGKIGPVGGPFETVADRLRFHPCRQRPSCDQEKQRRYAAKSTPAAHHQPSFVTVEQAKPLPLFLGHLRLIRVVWFVHRTLLVHSRQEFARPGVCPARSSPSQTFCYPGRGAGLAWLSETPFAGGESPMSGTAPLNTSESIYT